MKARQLLAGTTAEGTAVGAKLGGEDLYRFCIKIAEYSEESLDYPIFVQGPSLVECNDT